MKWNRKNFRYFDFDVLMTNPPFAGDVKDSRILHQYEVAKNAGGRWQKKAARDVLFVERNLEFLRPGGRMCIVLPQGRLNNVNPNRKIFEARKRETAALGAGEKLVLGHPLAATIGDSARCMQNLEKVLFTGPKTSDTVTFICD